jgi:flagellar motor protein MotB
VNRLANFLLGTAMMAVSFTLHAEEPDLSQLQQSLQAEQKRIEALTKMAEQAAANQQELKSLQQQNQQLTAAVTQLHEQIQVAEGRATNAEAERDQLRTEVANLRQQAAAATEDARQSLAALVTRIKELNDAAVQQASAATTPDPVLVEAPKPPVKQQVLARNAATAPAPKPSEPVQTAAVESEHVDERAVLGGRPTVLSFADLPQDRRQEARSIIASLHSTTDARGLITTIPGDLLFAPSSDLIEPAAHSALDKVAKLITLLHNRNVLVIGHSGSRGATASHRTLSADQAAAVRQYLIDQGKIQERRLSASGAGDSQPGGSMVEVVILN